MISKFKPVERLKYLKASETSQFLKSVREMPACINLGVGEPDFCPPLSALKAGWEAAQAGKTHYEPTNGIPELRQALVDKMIRDNGLKYDPENEVLVTVGGAEALFLSLFGLLNPGDEVLFPSPGFVLYEPEIRLAGGIPIPVPLVEERRFKPDIDYVMSLVTEKSRVIILNFPNNPTGAMLSYEETASLAQLAVSRDLIVISDEVYEKIIYDGAKHYCFATFPEMRERTLVVNSFSKTYAMTGLRVGYVHGPRELISALRLVHQYTVTCVNSLSQYVALEALREPQSFIEAMVEEFNKRRHLVYERLTAMGFHCNLPEGAFYVFPSIKQFRMSSEEFAKLLIKEAHVITVPGTAFGSDGEGYIRISYAAAYDKLEEAMDRIEKAIGRL